MAPRSDLEVPVGAAGSRGVDAPRTGPREYPTGVWSTPRSRLGLIVVTLVPILANLPAILGFVKYQPTLLTSGLGVISQKGYIPGQPFIDPNVGYNSQAVGHAAALLWLHGHVPWWNLNDGLGMPLAASVQSAAFLPLTLLQAVASGSMWFHLSLEIIAGVATYALLRQLRCSPFAAAVGGLAFGLNGSLAWITNAPANPVPFLPLCLLGVELVVQSAGVRRRGGWILLAVGVWLSIVAGFPEVAVINAGLVGCWFVVRLAQHWRDRLAIVLRAGTGVLVGFLLAAPLLNAFVRYLKVANVGIHVYPLATFTLPSSAVAMFVSPYGFGGIFDSNDPSVYESWTRMGGYAGATLVVLAIGSLWGRRERVLRLVLAGWALLFVGSNFDVPVLHQVVENLPGLTHLAVYRYDTASALLCLCLLAALCVDDLRGLGFLPVLARLGPGIAAVLALFAIGFLSSPGGRAYAHLHLPRWYWGSLALFVVILGTLVLAVVLALAGRRSLVTIVVGLLLVVEAFGYFEIPILAWPRQAQIDAAPLTYLRQHLGVQRYFSTGPAAPNYAAYYSIPSLGASDLPIPKNWGVYVHDQLSPCILAWQLGNGGPIAGCPITPVIASMKYVTGYEESGVKYLLVGHRTDLAMFMQPEIGTGPPTEDGGINVQISYGPPAYFHTGVLTRLAVDMPGGPPPGLVASVCSSGTCVSATPVGPGVGGEEFSLSAPLVLKSLVTISLTGSAESPVHVVTVPGPPGVPPFYVSKVVADGVSLPSGCGASAKAPPCRQARVTFFYAPSSIPRLVRSTALAHVWLLPHPAAIATAPGCAVVAHTMTSFTASCTRPSVLTYRELSFKGWSATVGGRAATIATASNGVFQQVALPAGVSTVEFSFLPPHTQLAWFAVLLGLLAIACSLARRQWPQAFAWWPWSPTTDDGPPGPLEPADPLPARRTAGPPRRVDP